MPYFFTKKNLGQKSRLWGIDFQYLPKKRWNFITIILPLLDSRLQLIDFQMITASGSELTEFT